MKRKKKKNVSSIFELSTKISPSYTFLFLHKEIKIGSKTNSVWGLILYTFSLFSFFFFLANFFWYFFFFKGFNFHPYFCLSLYIESMKNAFGTDAAYRISDQFDSLEFTNFFFDLTEHLILFSNFNFFFSFFITLFFILYSTVFSIFYLFFLHMAVVLSRWIQIYHWHMNVNIHNFLIFYSGVVISFA